MDSNMSNFKGSVDNAQLAKSVVVKLKCLVRWSTLLGFLN